MNSFDDMDLDALIENPFGNVEIPAEEEDIPLPSTVTSPANPASPPVPPAEAAANPVIPPVTQAPEGVTPAAPSAMGVNAAAPAAPVIGQPPVARPTATHTPLRQQALASTPIQPVATSPVIPPGPPPVTEQAHSVPPTQAVQPPRTPQAVPSQPVMPVQTVKTPSEPEPYIPLADDIAPHRMDENQPRSDRLLSVEKNIINTDYKVETLTKIIKHQNEQIRLMEEELEILRNHLTKGTG